MTWKKYFKPTTGISGPSISSPDRKFTSVQKYSSWLPEIYEGPSDRLARYQIYETMDYDHEVHAALDTIADFSTENDSKTKRPFTIVFDGNPAPTEITIVSKMLKQWCTLNEMDKRLWGMFRGTLMYGDQFFIRDPETFKLFWCDPKKVTKAIVNESKGKKIECFYIKDLDLNVKDMIATSQQQGDQGRYAGASIMFSAPFNGVIGFGNATSGNAVTDGRFGEEGEVPINADHMLHLTLSDGMTSSWPFGTSILEYVYKVYKQKELLEDSVIIYRIHRAPERRVFFIDVGQMPPNKAQQYLERVRYEVQQKRIPSKSGGGASLTDSGYNPMSQLEDYFFSVTSEGRGSSVQTLPGGENLGCFSLDTKVKLLDGRDLSISEIEKEMKEGKQLWTYSCDPISGEIAPGKIDWAGTTRKNADVLKITLDNGEEIICTPDHKFPIKGRGFVEAKDLSIGQSLLGVYTKNEFISESKKLDYTQIYDHSIGEYIYVHRMVADYFIGTDMYSEFVYDSKYSESKKDTRHHVNHNRYDNDPTNIVWMNFEDHRKYHSDYGFSEESQKLGTIAAKEKMSYLKKHCPEKYNEIISKQVSKRQKTMAEKSDEELELISKKISRGIKEYISNLSEKELEERAKRSRENGKLAINRIKKLMEDPEYRKFASEMTKSGIERSKQLKPEVWAERSKKISEANKTRWKIEGYYDKVFEAQKIKFNNEMFEIVTDKFSKCKKPNKDYLVGLLNDDNKFMSIFRALNENSHTNSNLNTFTTRHLSLLLQSVGLKWTTFIASNTEILVDDTLEKIAKIYKKNSSFDEVIEVMKNEKPVYGKSNSRHNLMNALKERGINSIKVLKGYIENVNHRVVSVEYLSEKMDVGTLTVDYHEKYHDYHTYALSAGVFVKNSIDDLRYFNNKMLRALGVPSSYLPTGPEDGTASYNDGRLGTAFIQEFRFSKVCERYQKQISKAFDREFKLYLKHRGVNIDNSTFEIKLPEPQSFSEYRQLELDAAKINVFQSMADIPYISKRFALKRYLNLSEEEMAMNEKMWKEEQGAVVKQQSSAKNDLSSAGITSSGIESMAPMGGFDEEEFTDDLVDDFSGEEDFGDEGFDTDVDLDGEEPEV